MLPHDGVGVGTPTPRNDRAASNWIVEAIPSVAYTTMSETRCGMTCRVRIRRGPTPTARAAVTNSASRMTTARAYTTRAIGVQRTTAITRVTSVTLGRRIATRAI